MLPIHKQLQKSIKGLLALLVFASQVAYASHDGESAGTLHKHNHECVLCLFEEQGDVAPAANALVLSVGTGVKVPGSANVAPVSFSAAHFSIRAPPAIQQ